MSCVIYTFENMAVCCLSENLSLCETRESRAAYGSVEKCFEESVIVLSSPFERTPAIKSFIKPCCGTERKQPFRTVAGAETTIRRATLVIQSACKRHNRLVNEASLPSCLDCAMTSTEYSVIMFYLIN